MYKYTRVCQNAMAHIFISRYMQVRTPENFAELHYKIAEDTVILQYSLHLWQQPSSA
jgi:hypothetical protein